MGKSSTSYQIGNEAALKWTEEEVKKIFIQMLENAVSDAEILCLQDAIRSVDLYSSSVNYLIDKYPVFESLKNDIAEVIKARLNNGGLKGDFNPTIVIWRSKQLGDKDTQYQEVNSTVQQTNIISIGKGKKPK